MLELRGRAVAGVVVLLAAHLAPLGAAENPPSPSSSSYPGFDPASLDTSTRPCVDFYQYACGGWIAKNPIPPDQASWGRFDELAERNRNTLRQILEAAAPEDPKRTANQQLIGDFYAACMDEKGIEAKGLGPIQADLTRIVGLESKAELPAVLAALH